MRILRVTSLGIVVAVVLAACGGGSSPSEADVDSSVPATAADVAETTPVATAAPEEQIVARCAVKDGDEYAEVGCDEPHDAEFAALVGPPEGVSPTDADEFENALKTHCLDAVEELTGRSSAKFGVEIGATTTDQPGATFAADVECWAETTAEGTLTASLREATLEEALGDNVIVGDIEPGNCYVYVDEQEDSYDLGRIVDCDEPFAEMVLGIATSDVVEYPGDDGAIEIGDELCAAVADGVDFEVSGDTVAFIFPGEFEWEARSLRDYVCTSYRSSGYAEEGLDGASGAFCAIKDGTSFDEVDCSEPHDMEYVGAIAPPVELLPEDYDEAVSLLVKACVPTVSDYLGGRDLSRPGVSASFSADVDLGQPFVGDVDCFVIVGSAAGLSAAIADVGLDAAFGDFRIVAELEPGTCFVNPPDSFDLGTVVPCETPDALMQLGTFVVDSDGPHPGDDPLRAIRAERCPQVVADSGLADLIDISTLSGVIPSGEGWRDLGRRTITCDASPL